MVVSCFMALLGIAPHYAHAEDYERQDLIIPSQSLEKALAELARKTNIQFVYLSDIQSDVRTSPLEGLYEPESALSHLLAGTGLTHEFVDSNTIIIRVASAESNFSNAENLNPAKARAAQRNLSVQQSTSSEQVAQAASERESASSLALEEIVVTARKREESLLEVPIAMTAITAANIESYNFSDFDEVQYITPGLTFTEAGNGIRNDRNTYAYIFRGINVGESGGGSSAATLFIDGAPSLFGRLTGFSNTERIEILKGPQTAYFGRNTFTGAINVVTKNPGNEWQSRISGEIAKFGSSDVDISVEGPLLSEKVSFRLSGRQLTKGGQYLDQSIGREIGGRQTKSIAGTLYATPTEQMNIKAFAEFVKFDDQLGPIFNYSTEFFNCNASGGAVNNWICGEVPDSDIAEQRIGAPALFDSIFLNGAAPFSLFEERLKSDGGLGAEQITAHALADYTFSNGMIFDSIVAYHDKKVQILYEASHDASKADPLYPCTGTCSRDFGQHAFQLENKQNDFSAEFRLSSDQEQRLRWTVGANYIDAEQIPGLTYGELLFITLRPFGTGGNYATAETLAAFGGVYYDLTDRLTINAEFRHQRDKVGRIPVDLSIGPGKPSTDPAKQLSNTFKANAPRLTIEYSPTDNTLIYGSWARGFRPGTFNANILVLPQEIIPELRAAGATVDVDEEKFDQFEIGIKGSGLDGRFQGTLVGYVGSLKGQQITQGFLFNRPDINFVSGVNVITNSGKTDVKGVELEGSIAVTDQFVLDGSFAWNHTKVVTDSCATCVRLGGTLDDSVGNKLQNVPEFTGHLTGTYTQALTSDLDGYLRTEYFYQGTRYATRQNLAESGAMHRVNFRVGIRDARYSLEAFLVNAFNDDTVDGLSLENFFPEIRPGVKVGLPEKRQWGVRATYVF